MRQEQLEQLLNLKQYQVNYNNDQHFELLPIQPTYIQEMDKEVQKLEQQSLLLIQQKLIFLVQKQRRKRLRKMAKMQQLTEGWFGMKSQDQDETTKQEFLIMKLKKYLDPKQPIKSSDFKTMPKYFQVGTYVDGMEKENQSDLIGQFLEYDQEKQTTKTHFKRSNKDNKESVRQIQNQENQKNGKIYRKKNK